jgi:predicted membrane-bound spermidine synthase
MIALSAVATPIGIELGRGWLASFGAAWGSLTFHLLAGIWIAALLLPFCICMGATIPLAMWAIRLLWPSWSRRSFSYLYLANVIGACLGTLVSAFVLIELLGFRRTALLAMAVNVLIAASALYFSCARGVAQRIAVPIPSINDLNVETARPARTYALLAVIFMTGFSSMGMEVVWVRVYTPYLGTVVYTFALIVSLYLLATFIGSALYRRWSRSGAEKSASPQWSLLAPVALLVLVAVDPRLSTGEGFLGGALRALVGIAPICGALGFLTPWLVDRWSQGDARQAGNVYALNVAGCILGPLIAGFVLLPYVGESWALFLLALPLLVAGWIDRRPMTARVVAAMLFSGVASITLLYCTRDFVSLYPDAVVRRDHSATVVAQGQGRSKRLLVNGVGMTTMSTITKMMAHLPIAALGRPPEHGLVVCLGMGTSFRSMHAWGGRTTAIELVPSVPSLLPFFHDDGATLLGSPRGRVVVDDGRRFLERTADSYDVVTIDPPPPIEASGSSLLYSREFYQVVKRRLRPGGVVLHWLPSGDAVVKSSVTRAIVESFPCVAAYRSLRGWGFHFIASDRPLQIGSARDLAACMPRSAERDLIEWNRGSSAEELFEIVLRQKVPLAALLDASRTTPALSDDRPFNEYYLMRRLSLL